MQVIPQVLRNADGGHNAVVAAVKLEPWLEMHEPALYAELFSGEVVPLDDVTQASAILEVGELEAHARRIRAAIDDDPAQAVGSAKELLETVLRTILGEYGAQPAGDIRELLKRVQRKLKLDPASADGRPGAETIRRTLNNLGQVVIGVAEVRNLYGTGHGRSRAAELERAHAKLTVNAAVTLATFLTDVFRASNWSPNGRRESDSPPSRIRSARSLASFP
jgi:Abortive infection C-terminus